MVDFTRFFAHSYTIVIRRVPNFLLLYAETCGTLERVRAQVAGCGG